jgi:hypothetical protein
LNSELPHADLDIVPPVPSLFQRKEALQACTDQRGVQAIDIQDLDFEIDAAAIRLDEFCFGPKAVVTVGLLQHQLGALPFEIGESLLVPA